MSIQEPDLITHNSRQRAEAGFEPQSFCCPNNSVLSRPLSSGWEMKTVGVETAGWGQKGRKLRPKAKSWGRFLRRGSKPLPPAGAVLWAPPTRFAAKPRPPKGCPLFSALRMVSPDTNIVGQSCSHWDATPLYPPLAYAPCLVSLGLIAGDLSRGKAIT